MPIKDGYQATKEIRNHENGKSVPIIAMTAGALSEEKKKCLDSGMNAYLTKPITLDRFKECLVKNLVKAA